MKIAKRILVGVLVLLSVAAVAALVMLQNIKTAAIPNYGENVEMQGLSAEVTVFRDSLGIPHVYAENQSDLYRAVGFAMAQDRLWQMDLLRRVTQGRLSEILGKDQINTDLLMRALQIQPKSEKILQGAAPQIIEALEAFADGVNQYIAKSPLPPEFKVLGYRPDPWEPVHSINLIGYMSWDLSAGWGTEYLLHLLRKEIPDELIADLIPQLDNHETPIFPNFGEIEISNGTGTMLSASEKLAALGAEVFSGSNNWAIAGTKSKTGKPLLANDMHLGLFAPGIWYQMHQNVAGKLNVTGVVLPGQPFIISGHNDSIAWGMTNVMVDDLDFYAEKINADTTQYFFDGQWKNFRIEKQIIKTKEGDEIEKVLRFTHRGPMVNLFKTATETPLSIRWLGNEMSNEIRTVFLLNRANNWADFRNAVSTFKSVSQNIVYADVKGNIGLQCSAGVPIRAGSGIQIYPGDSSKYDWQGLVPFEELPYEYNPPRGYVSSANNKTVGSRYPYYISRWFAPPHRINRIREMLEEKELLGVADFKAMHADVKSLQAEKMVPVFLKAFKMKNDWNETEKVAIAKLQNWDFQLFRQSQAASIYENLYLKLCENLIRDDLSPELATKLKGERMLLENLVINILEQQNSGWIDDKTTLEKEDFTRIINRAFAETVADLDSIYGPDVEDWKWEKMHTLTLSHPLGVVPALNIAFNLNRGPFGVPGSYHTVCPYSYPFNNLYRVNHGASHRHIYDAANWDNSETIIPTGTSGIPSSPFYLNQTQMYINNQYHDDDFSLSASKKNAVFKMKFLNK